MKKLKIALFTIILFSLLFSLSCYVRPASTVSTSGSWGSSSYYNDWGYGGSGYWAFEDWTINAGYKRVYMHDSGIGFAIPSDWSINSSISYARHCSSPMGDAKFIIITSEATHPTVVTYRHQIEGIRAYLPNDYHSWNERGMNRRYARGTFMDAGSQWHGEVGHVTGPMRTFSYMIAVKPGSYYNINTLANVIFGTINPLRATIQVWFKTDTGMQYRNRYPDRVKIYVNNNQSTHRHQGGHHGVINIHRPSSSSSSSGGGNNDPGKGTRPPHNSSSSSGGGNDDPGKGTRPPRNSSSSSGGGNDDPGKGTRPPRNSSSSSGGGNDNPGKGTRPPR